MRRRARSRGRTECAGSASRRRLPEHLVHSFAEPLEALRLRALDEPGPHDQDVVVRGWKRLEARSPELPQLALDLGADDRAAGSLRHCDPEPRVVSVLAREPVEDEEPRRGGPPMSVNGVEIPGAGEAVPALQIVV